MDAKEWLNTHKDFSHYDLEEYDEGGYLGINEEKLHEMMNTFANNSGILGAIVSHISQSRHIDDNYCLLNAEAPTEHMRGRHYAYDEIIRVITEYKTKRKPL